MEGRGWFKKVLGTSPPGGRVLAGSRIGARTGDSSPNSTDSRLGVWPPKEVRREAWLPGIGNSRAPGPLSILRSRLFGSHGDELPVRTFSWVGLKWALWPRPVIAPWNILHLQAQASALPPKFLPLSPAQSWPARRQLACWAGGSLRLQFSNQWTLLALAVKPHGSFMTGINMLAA